MMLNDRSAHLLREAAQAFQDGSNPFAGDWLGEHRVTASECMWLSNYIGVLLLGYVQSSEQTQKKILIAGVAGADLRPAYIDAAVDRPVNMKRLQELNGGQNEP